MWKGEKHMSIRIKDYVKRAISTALIATTVLTSVITSPFQFNTIEVQAATGVSGDGNTGGGTSGMGSSNKYYAWLNEERRQIRQMVQDDLIKYQKQSSSAGLQILFLFETGLRIGECCGLKWSDVKDNRLYVHRQADNDRVKETTKTSSGYRDIPLTKEAQRILTEVKKFNLEHGYRAEWIFQSNNPKYDYRLSYNAADRKLRKLCSRLDSELRSPHKCRKTCISTLLDSPVNDRTVQRFAGHQDISTTYTFYNYERKSKQEQAEAIEAALTI